MPKGAKINHTRKYRFNTDYFSVIDTKDKAYFFGWMLADGCNTRKFVSMHIKSSDRHILEMMCKYMKQDLVVIKNKPTIRGEYCFIRLSSVKMSQDLRQKGMVERKSLIVEFPSTEIIPTDLLSHFVRGFWEANGGLYAANGKYWNLRVSSTYKFLDELRRHIHKNTGVEMVDIKANGKIHLLYYPKRTNLFAITDWIYKDCGELFLKRKRVIVDKMYDQVA